MDATRNPMILLVTGSWHQPWHYRKWIEQINMLGYECICNENASNGEGQSNVTWEDDVRCIHDTVIPLFELGREVVIVAHSYGGIPACAATQGLGLSERTAEGLRGGFRHIMFLAAFAIPERGMDLVKTLGGALPDWVDHGKPYGNSRNMPTRVKEQGKAILYNDVPEDEAQRCFEALVPQCQAATETPVTFVAVDLTIPKTYIICEKDLALPVEIQEKMVASIAGFTQERIDAGHSPFLSKPKECAEIIIKIARH
ncbi:Alpha/beta hydrolase fold-1 [Whalleya microplaca]|nr:Alpha/beta hydrolase fold-1 [Whalleya microplaca]